MDPFNSSVPGQHSRIAYPPAVAEAGTDRAAGANRTAESAGLGSTVDRLRRLWSEVLGEDDIGQGADFFDLGGNSLTAVELMSQVRVEFSVEVGIVVLFEHSALEALAKQIDRRAR